MKWLGRQKTCPIGREKLCATDLVVNRLASAMIDELKIVCPTKISEFETGGTRKKVRTCETSSCAISDGCPWINRLDCLDSHLLICDFVTLKCSHCQATFLRKSHSGLFTTPCTNSLLAQYQFEESEG